MPLDSMIDLGHYWLFIEGALPGAPSTIGGEALGSTVYDVAREINMTYLPRMSLQIVELTGRPLDFTNNSLTSLLGQLYSSSSLLNPLRR